MKSNEGDGECQGQGLLFYVRYKEGLTDRVTLVQSPEGREGGSHVDIR